MRNRGVVRPGRNMIVCLLLAAGGAAAILWGAMTAERLGHETGATAAAIGLGLFAALLGSLFFLNFCWAWRIVRALRRGDGVIGRWRVAAATLDRLRAAEQAPRGNDWRMPRRTPPDGLEVVFSADAVLIGDTLFGLATSGLSRIGDARLVGTGPWWLEFGTTLSWMSSQPTVRVHRSHGVLRIPVADHARTDAVRVLAHFQDVLARRTIVKPHFWRSRIRAGLAMTLAGAIAASVGFALRGATIVPVELLVFLAVAGTMVALGGLVLALAAAGERRRQYRG